MAGVVENEVTQVRIRADTSTPRRWFANNKVREFAEEAGPEAPLSQIVGPEILPVAYPFGERVGSEGRGPNSPPGALSTMREKGAACP